MEEAVTLFMPKLKGPSAKEIAKAKSVLEEHHKALKVRGKNSHVVCRSFVAYAPKKGCGAFLRIGDLTYIQTHFYVKPYGCTSGDFYREGEGEFICPKCGARNRLYNSPEVTNLKSEFALVVNEYE
jgi:hypothetical protein